MPRLLTFHQCKKLSMLLFVASIVLFPEAGRTAYAAKVKLNEAQTILTQAVGEGIGATQKASAEEASLLPERDVNGDGRVTAADAGMLLLYENGMLCALPGADGVIPDATLDGIAAATERYLASRALCSVAKAEEKLTTDRLSVYGRLAENRAAFAEMSQSVKTSVEGAVREYMAVLSAMLYRAGEPLHPFGGVENAPDWKSMAALYRAYGEDTEDALRASLRCTLEPYEGGGVRVALSFGTHDEIAAYGSREQLLSAKFAYAYLNTVYGAQGELLAPAHDTFDAAYLAQITHPLPGCTIKNGWYDPRDNGTRLHMGTDILARARTPIHAAARGTVMYVGFMAIPGNYVVIRGDDGYEYHYYHLFQRSRQVREGDTIERGDVIGLVGNTGNSAANHLHLTIISPEYRYVNPYDLYTQAGIGPIKPDDGARYLDGAETARTGEET